MSVKPEPRRAAKHLAEDTRVARVNKMRKLKPDRPGGVGEIKAGYRSADNGAPWDSTYSGSTGGGSKMPR